MEIAKHVMWFPLIGHSCMLPLRTMSLIAPDPLSQSNRTTQKPFSHLETGGSLSMCPCFPNNVATTSHCQVHRIDECKRFFKSVKSVR